MGIQRISIDQQFAQIGVRSTPARLNIRMPRGQITIKNEPPQMTVERKPARFRVNRQQINSESGLKGPLELAKVFRDSGKQAAHQAIAQNKNDGNFLGNLKIKGDRVSRLAANKANARLGMKDFNVGLMPQSPPDLQWDKGYIRVNWSKHKLTIDYNGGYKPDMTVDPKYSVEVFIRREPYFRVMVEEAVSSTGRIIDKAV